MVNFLGTKTISLDEEAYNRLKALKRGNESFTDVVMRITKGHPTKSFYDLAGSWEMSDEEEKEMLGILEKMWGDFNESLLGQRLSDRIFKKS